MRLIKVNYYSWCLPQTNSLFSGLFCGNGVYFTKSTFLEKKKKNTGQTHCKLTIVSFSLQFGSLETCLYGSLRVSACEFLL